MAKKTDDHSRNATKMMQYLTMIFVVRQPSVTRLAFTNDSLVFKKIEVFLEAPDVLVDVAHGAGDNDGNEKKKVKLKQNQIPEIR